MHDINERNRPLLKERSGLPGVHPASKLPCAVMYAPTCTVYMLSPRGSPRMTMLWKYSITPESDTSRASHCGQSNVSL
mgnify:CR=1 FL=1